MAMNINELMIGNLVYANVYHYDPTQIPEITQVPVKVIGIWDNVMAEYEDKRFILHLDRLIPIQLTAEILERLGFREEKWDECFGKKAYRGFLGPSECSFFYIRGLGEHPTEWRIYNSENMIVRYVHQLQNALQLCGLEELACKFKI